MTTTTTRPATHLGPIQTDRAAREAHDLANTAQDTVRAIKAGDLPAARGHLATIEARAVRLRSYLDRAAA